MNTAKLVPDGHIGWIVLDTKGRPVTQLLQSPEQAKCFCEEGYRIVKGRIEKGTGNFISSDLDKMR